jgi:hypothetical protein
MSQFAASTSVSPEKSRMEIERILKRYKASGFAYGSLPDRAVIMFEMHNRRIRFHVPFPDKKEFWKTEGGRLRHSESIIEKSLEQATKQRWRALALAIKAKLEAVESKITTFEEEFMAHILLPNGKTVGDVMIPQIEQSYESKKMPPLLGYSG